MTTRKFHRTIVPLSLLAAATGWSQDSGLQMKAEPPIWRANLGYRAGFNLKPGFKNVGSYAAATDPGTDSAKSNHTYDDGYNLLDSSGNNHFGTPATIVWGYLHDGQYDPTGNGGQGTIAMHSSSSTGASSGSHDADLTSGMELSFTCEIEQNQHWNWGLEAAFNYTGLSITDSRNLAGNTTRLTDIYQLNGVVPAAAPYYGSEASPGAYLGDLPTRSYAVYDLPVTGSRKLDADLFGFRFGPYLELPITKKLSLTLNAGLAVAIVNSEYSFDQYITTPDSGTFHAAGSHSNTDVLLGGYIGANLVLRFSDHWSAFGGAQWQDVGSYTNDPRVTGAGAATLDLQNAIFVSVGVGYTF